MIDKYAIRFTAFSLYTLAIAIFISVSFVSVYHILTLVAFILLFTRKEINFKNLPASAWALLMFIGTQLLSASVNFAELDEKSRSIGIIKYPLVAIFSLILFRYQKLQNNDFFKKHSRMAFNIFLATIIIAFAYGFTRVNIAPVLLKSNDFRVAGFTDVMRYGYGTAIVLLILLTICLNTKKFSKLNKKYLWLTFVIGCTALFLSYTRGAMLGFLIGIPAVLFYFNKRISAAIAIFSITAIALMVIVALMGGSKSSRFLMSAKSGSNTERMSLYLSAIHAFQERPILGFGPQQLKFRVKEIKEKYNLEHKDYIQHAHNVYLEIVANTGIVGLVAFLAWLGLWCNDILRSGALTKQIFLPVILFILVAGQFEMLLIAQTSTLIYFLYAISHHKIFQKEPAT